MAYGFCSILALAVQSPPPPGGGVSPLAWSIIGALVFVIMTTIPAIWYRGNKQYDKVYDDLKSCNESRIVQEEEVLGVLKVVRLQMEQSRGGRVR